MSQNINLTLIRLRKHLDIKEALSFYFGYDEFRPGQEEIIKAIVNGENIIAILPTGGGKSLCYQIPALITDGFSIVISPLIALMKDQVDTINKKNQVAAFINSTLGYGETETVLREIHEGKIKLLYLAPEKLESNSFAEKIKNLAPQFLFVDEAHCISEWGHSFRPSYRKIKEFADFVALKNISAFTATATPEVRKDISVQLGMENPKIFVKGFERENLNINVLRTKNKKEQCVELVKNYGTPAIIYTSSRRASEEISEYLNLYGMSASYYHAGMEPQQRKHIQEQFLTDKIKIISATTAFGMGIDKADIRLIIHYNMPGTIENYYQEIGRAGRDGNEAFAFLLYEGSDRHIHKYFIESSYPDEALIVSIYNAICDHQRIAVGNTYDKEIPVDQKYISSYVKQDISRAKIASAINILAQSGYLKAVNEFQKRNNLLFNIGQESLKKYLKTTSNYVVKDLLILLLRKYGNSILNSGASISIESIALEYGTFPEYIEDILLQLTNTGILEYYKPLLQPGVILSVPRVSEENLFIDADKIEMNCRNALNKLDQMVEYIKSDECRMKFIINYFGEDIDHNSSFLCGKCDNCLQSKDEFLTSLHSPEGQQVDNLNFGFEENLELFNKLREARTTASKKFQQSAFLVCSDDILRRIAEKKPLTPQEFLSVKGVSLRMFNKIGQEFLEIIKEYQNVKNDSDAPIPKNILETYKLLKQGYNLNAISELRKLTPAVISMQIETIVEFDPAVEVVNLFNPGEFEKIESEIKKGFIDLRDLKSRLPSDIGFPLLRIAVAKNRLKR